MNMDVNGSSTITCLLFDIKGGRPVSNDTCIYRLWKLFNFVLQNLLHMCMFTCVRVSKWLERSTPSMTNCLVTTSYPSTTKPSSMQFHIRASHPFPSEFRSTCTASTSGVLSPSHPSTQGNDVVHPRFQPSHLLYFSNCGKYLVHKKLNCNS
jgi:hypothetical protein